MTRTVRETPDRSSAVASTTAPIATARARSGQAYAPTARAAADAEAILPATKA